MRNRLFKTIEFFSLWISLLDYYQWYNKSLSVEYCSYMYNIINVIFFRYNMKFVNPLIIPKNKENDFIKTKQFLLFSSFNRLQFGLPTFASESLCGMVQQSIPGASSTKSNTVYHGNGQIFVSTMIIETKIISLKILDNKDF